MPIRHPVKINRNIKRLEIFAQKNNLIPRNMKMKPRIDGRTAILAASPDSQPGIL